MSTEQLEEAAAAEAAEVLGGPEPLAGALRRKLRKLDRRQPEAPPGVDADAIAFLVVERWGDQAPEVLAEALELARRLVAQWTPPAPAAEPEQ